MLRCVGELMGKFDFQIPDDFIKRLGRLADVDRVAPQMIDEAMPILEKSVKNVLSSHRVSGDMLSSIRHTKAGKNKNGYYAVVRPTGRDSNGVRNMEKAVYLEYGTSKVKGGSTKDKQPPRPWVDKSINDCKAAVLDKMQEVFNREMGK